MNRAYISSGIIFLLIAVSPLLCHPISLLAMQVIQTVSAVDKDDPIQGHYFDYRLLPEMLNNPNFTIKNNQGRYENILHWGSHFWQKNSPV